MNELDPRIVKVSFEINGQLKIYEGLAITATGTKYANANQNEMEVKVSNLDKITRNFLLTETSPFNKNRTRKRVILEVGRVSTGTFVLFTGDITATTPSPGQSKTPVPDKKNGSPGHQEPTGTSTSNAATSQPPDITITVKALTGDFMKGNIVAKSQPAKAKLSKISKDVADDLGLILDYQAADKDLANYSFTGGKLNQVQKIGDAGNVDAYVDDGVLVVKDANKPLNNRVRKLDLSSGMIGIPEITEQGVKVKFLVDNQTVLGGALQITSQLYPAINGTYTIFKLSFDIASRDTPFYYIAEAKRRDENG